VNTLRCAVVRRRLGAYHDDELGLHERVAIASHLRGCLSCACEAAHLSALSAMLREMALARANTPPALEATGRMIATRVQAERDTSLLARVGRLFDDMHFVWAGLSAAGATATCAALLFAIWFLSPPERADSLAGVLSALAAPGSDRNPVTLDLRMNLPRVAEDAVVPAMLANEATEEDLVFALAAVVTREGRIARSELLLPNRGDREVALRLMNAVREARFQPARLRGHPVAVNVVWLLTHTTVRGKRHS
jgi:hypothetical protein